MTALPAFLIGVVAGSRSMTAPAAMSWAAHLGLLHVGGTWAAFLANGLTRWALSVLAVGELVADQLPSTPSRTTAFPFAGRIATGGLSGAAIGAGADATLTGLLAGVVGAFVGTIGGFALRARLAAAFGHDRTAAFAEDAIALGGAAVVMALLR